MSNNAAQPIRLFYSYAHEDEPFRHTLDKHLSVLKRTGVIAPWHDRRISAGADWAVEIDRYLEEAQLILLLVSADFLSSDYCWGVEMERALLKHEAGTARVIPIMVRPVDFFEGVPFAKLQALPHAAKPITQWSNQDAAWADVARGIRMASQEMRGRIVAPDDERIVSQERSVARDAEIPVPGRFPERLDATALDELYEAYWTRFSELVGQSGTGLRPPTPRASNYVRFSLGSSDRWMNAFASVRDRYIGVELVLRQPRYTPEYGRLEAARVQIEQEFGAALEWKELQGSYRIALSQYGFDIQNRADWARQHDWLIGTVKQFQRILLKHVDAQ